MDQGSEGCYGGAPDASRSHSLGAVRVTRRGSITELYFPPLRAAGSALMLALFGTACCVIGGAAILGLFHSGATFGASLFAFAFAGVFILPLMGLGLWFIAIAVWTAANSVTVDVSNLGLQAERAFLGYALARRVLKRDDITALDVKLAAKYVGAFGAVRYYRIVASGSKGAVLIADSLKGPEVAEQLRNLIIEQLEMPALAAGSNKVPVVIAERA